MPLYVNTIYVLYFSFMFWKSGTGDLSVLMSLVVQYTDYQYIFLTISEGNMKPL